MKASVLLIAVAAVAMLLSSDPVAARSQPVTLTDSSKVHKKVTTKKKLNHGQIVSAARHKRNAARYYAKHHRGKPGASSSSGK